MEMQFSSIEEALAALQQGKGVIVVDSADRENEADIIYAAEKITEKNVAFMLQHTSGIICVPMTAQRLDALKIPLMVSQNTSKHGCAFTVSVDAAPCHTGVSAAERACTIRSLAFSTQPSDFVQPGHIFPLRAAPGGILERQGHTEATVELCTRAGLQPIGVLAELMNSDGTMMRGSTLFSFAQQHQFPLLSIEQLLSHTSYALTKEHAVSLPTSFGMFSLIPYTESQKNVTHLVLVHGNVSGKENVLVRIHSECLTGDVFTSGRCDCGQQLHAALEEIHAHECGVLLYLRQEGRGVGLQNKLAAYHLQEKGYDTVDANILLGLPADGREYGIAAAMLKDLGIQSIVLLTNNPHKIESLQKQGILIVERKPLFFPPTVHNQQYMTAKKEKFGHLFGV